MLEKNYEQARQNYQAFLEDPIENKELISAVKGGLAVVLEGEGQFKQAAETYLEAIEENPEYFNNDEFLLSAAQAYEAAGDTTAAIKIYKRFVKEYPESPKLKQAKERFYELNKKG